MAGLTPTTTQGNPHTDQPLSGYQQKSALDTLAEVSRHHLDYSSHRSLVDAFTEQALIAQLQEGVGPSSPVTAANSASLYIPATDAKSHYLPQASDMSVVTSALSNLPLMQTASAANQQLELTQSRPGSLVDPQLHMDLPVQAPMGTYRDSNGSNTMTWNPARSQQTFGNLTMPSAGAAPSPGFDSQEKPTKPKSRSHFNDTRRQEVRDIRKRGACMRCRMLKKPCSGETPCSTCQNVESARLWKGTCIRTRLAEEFNLWSTRLFYTKAKIEVPAAVYGLEQQSLPGRLEARFLAASGLCLNLATKAYSQTLQGAHPSVQNGHANNQAQEEFWLLEEDIGMSDKLEAYTDRVAEDFVNTEQNLFIRATLENVRTLSGAEQNQLPTSFLQSQDQRSPRASYNLQNELVKNVVHLWILTRVLTSFGEHGLELRYNPTKTARLQLGNSTWSTEQREPSISDILPSSPSYALIKLQLMAAVEARCSKLGKSIVNELERRLLQRQQVSRFATFLSAVILLNSIERMTGFYLSFEGNESSWPLDTHPAALWPQGLYFSDLLTMLLRMRALPPKTAQNTEGTLSAMQDYSLPVHVSGRPIKEQIDEQTKLAASWLDPLQLKVSELLEKRDGQLPGKNDGLEEWDMRFVSKVLLPERMR